MRTRIHMVKGDITLVEADAIVNSANNDLVLGGGVSGAIRRVAGPAVQEECNRIGTIPLGESVVTSAGQLRAKWVIHAAVNPLGLWADPKSVRHATRNALKRADELKVHRLAFPAIGTGSGALPVERCADILIEEVLRHCSGPTGLEEVMFVLYDEKPYRIFEERFLQKVPPSTPGEVGPQPTAPAAPKAPAAESPSPPPSAEPQTPVP